MNNSNQKNNMPFFLRDGWIDVFSSLICIILGFLIGYIVLLCINKDGASQAIVAILKNYFYYKNPKKVLYYFGSTLVKSVPLLLCSLSILFAKKAGLFNIGVAGQYTIGAGIAIWFALKLNMPWYICILAATTAGALYAMLTGIFKAYRNVNEVISGIMLNWIALYLINMLLTTVKDPESQYTASIEDNASAALLPRLNLSSFFGGNDYVTIALLIAPIIAVIVYIILKKTLLGYELCATGYNQNAAFYSGMKEKRNIVMTTVISGALAGLGAAFIYLTDIEQWTTSSTVVPAMGFDGISAAFLGGLNPIGTIFSSYFIKHITIGGAYIDKNMYSSQTADMISGFIIYFCAFVQFFRHIATGIYKSRQGGK